MRRHRARRTGGFRRRALAAGRVRGRRGHGARAVGRDVAVPSPGKCARAFRRPVGPGVPRPVRSAVDDGRVAVTQPDTKWWTLGAVCLGTFMLLLDITIVNVALPSIQTDLGSSFADLQWVVDAYALTLAALLLTGGALADMYGRRRLYTIGLVVFSLASLLCGLARSPLMLELSRGLPCVG